MPDTEHPEATPPAFVETLIEAALGDKEEADAETATLTGIGIPGWVATPLVRGVAGANGVPIAGPASAVDETDEPIGLRLAISEETRDEMRRWYQVSVATAALATTEQLSSEDLVESAGEPFADAQNSREPTATNIRLIPTDRQGRSVGHSMFTTSALEGVDWGAAAARLGVEQVADAESESDADTDDESADSDADSQPPLGGVATRGRPFDDPPMVFTAQRAWTILPTTTEDGETTLEAVELGTGDTRNALLRSLLPAWDISQPAAIDTATPDFVSQTLERDLPDGFLDAFTEVLGAVPVANSSRYEHTPLAGAIVIAGAQSGATLKQLKRPCDYLELVSARPLSRAREELIDVGILADETGDAGSKANIIADSLQDSSTAEISRAAEARIYGTFPEPESTRPEPADEEEEDEEAAESEASETDGDGEEVDDEGAASDSSEGEEGDAADSAEDDPDGGSEGESEADESADGVEAEADPEAAEADD